MTNMVKILQPTSSLKSKFFYFREKYGLIHTICSYIGRYNRFFWKLVGPNVTRSYLINWEKTAEHRIVNLGGGNNTLDGCLTVDIKPRADAYVDITKPLPFTDNSIDGIFCEEVIEHIKFDNGYQLLKECFRILKPDGVIRLSTPDLNWFASRVSQSIKTCDEINTVFYNHGHRYLYTQEALYFYCQEVGFTNLKISKYQDSNAKLGYLDSHADRFSHPPEISQYLEAQKPN